MGKYDFITPRNLDRRIFVSQFLLHWSTRTFDDFGKCRKQLTYVSLSWPYCVHSTNWNCIVIKLITFSEIIELKSIKISFQ